MKCDDRYQYLAARVPATAIVLSSSYVYLCSCLPWGYRQDFGVRQKQLPTSMLRQKQIPTSIQRHELARVGIDLLREFELQLFYLISAYI